MLESQNQEHRRLCEGLAAQLQGAQHLRISISGAMSGVKDEKLSEKPWESLRKALGKA